MATRIFSTLRPRVAGFCVAVGLSPRRTGWLRGFLRATFVVALASSTATNSFADDARSSVMAAQRAQLDQKSYHIDSTIESGIPPKRTTAVVEVVAPDRFRMVQGNRETLVVGKETFVRVGGKWTRSPVNLAGLIAQFRNPKSLEALSNEASKGFAVAGSESVNGTLADIYTYVSDFAGVHSDIKLWVSRSSHLPVKQEIVSSGKFGTVKTSQVLRYVDGIVIERPAV